jgi:formate--tetrahydrofolate ligase
VDFNDLKKRLGDIVVGRTSKNEFVYARQLGCVEGMAILLKDAIKPNLVRSEYGSLAFVHAGPFANVAHGCNSIIATKMALKSADYVITEAGFGSDLGAQKFFDIKAPLLGKIPNLVVVVATIQAIKYHGSYDDEKKPIENGLLNLNHHIDTIIQRGIPFIISLNIFDSDSNKEINEIIKWADHNNYPISKTYGFIKGAKGCVDLANKVTNLCADKVEYKPLYNLGGSTLNKIKSIATKVYGAKGVVVSKKAQAKLMMADKFAYPVCVAKTPLSLSDNPKLLNVPSDFELNISDIVLNNGSKILVCLTKGIVTLPGLNEHPRFEQMALCDNGDIKL